MLGYVWLYTPPQKETEAREQEGSKGGFPCFRFAATQISSMRCKFKLDTHFSCVDYKAFQLNEIPQS